MAGIKSDIILNDKMSPVLRDMNRAVKDMTRAMGDFEASGESLDGLEKKLRTTAVAASRAQKSIQATGGVVENLRKDIATGEEALNSFKNKIESFKNTIGKIGNVLAHPFKNFSNLLKSIRSSITSSASSLKKLTQTKITKLASDFKNLKTTITSDKSGIAGFKSALSNIGKMSLGKTVSAFEKLKSTLSGGVAKAKEMASALKKAGATGMGKLFGALGTVGSKLGSLAKSAAGPAFNGMKKLASVSFKALSVGFGVAAAGVAKLTKSAVESYGNYEQLVGGVETLFGTGGLSLKQYAKQEGESVADARSEYKTLTAAQNAVFKNANDAYKTAGLSANEYMETATGFAASLVSSLGGDTTKAAAYADMAVIDMADNANKMGTDMSSIQNAYQGFAKQNYTMLDNLKLGYGGTKEEMERLLKDAQKISGQKYDISSFADITDAIHVMQTEMGITGTTAKEAEGTIQGSLNMMKASWQNMLTALVTGGDQYDQCVQNLVSSVKAFARNIIPAIKGALNGIGSLITDLAPVIIAELPGLIQDVLPGLITAATSIISSLGTALPGIIQALVDLVPTLLTMLDTLVGVIIDNLPLFLSAAIQIVIALINGIAERAPELIAKIFELCGELVQTIKDKWNDMKEAGKNLLKGLWNGIQSMKDWVVEKVKGIGSSIIGGLKSVLGIHSPSKEFAEIGDYLMQGLGNGVTDNAKYAITATESVAKDVLNAASGLNANAQIGATFTGVTGSTAELNGGTYDVMRNYAAQDSVNKFTTAQVNINMGGVTNQIASGNDVDDLITQFVDGVQEALSTASQGVHKR